MNEQGLSNLIALGEGFTTELKRAGASSLGRETCAFANATGGVILVGVADSGEIEDLGVKSVPRNPLLFGIFHRMNLVEKIGSGIRRIRQMCRDYEVAEPVFEVSEHWLTTIFARPTPQVGTKSAPSRHQVGTKLKSFVSL